MSVSIDEIYNKIISNRYLFSMQRNAARARLCTHRVIAMFELDGDNFQIFKFSNLHDQAIPSPLWLMVEKL